jgi:hypothetical protein
MEDKLVTINYEGDNPLSISVKNLKDLLENVKRCEYMNDQCMRSEAIIFIGVTKCMLGHKSRVKLFERTYEAMKKVIPKIPRVYQTFIPKVIRRCMKELTQNEWKAIGKTTSTRNFRRVKRESNYR